MPRFRVGHLLLVLQLAVGPAAAAQSSPDLLTLDQAISIAAASNRPTKIAALEEAKATSEIAALHARRFPSVDLRGLEGGFLSPLQFSFREGAFGTFPATGPIPFADTKVDSPRHLSTGIVVTAIQPITQLRRIDMGAKLFSLERDLDAQKTREQRQATVADVKRTYYGLQQTAAGLRAVDAALAQFDELERLVGQYVQRQLALESDHLAVEAEKARVEQTQLVLTDQEKTFKEHLNVLLARPLATPFTVAPLPESLGVDPDPDAAVAEALERRPAILEAKINVDRATQNLALSRSERLPDVSLGFGFIRLLNVDVLPPTTAAAAVLVSWEPFDWGRRTAENAQRARTLEQARLGVEEATAQVELDVRSKVRKLAEAREALRVARLSQTAAAERLRIATDRYRVEAALLKDVLDAQTALARTTSDYQQALGAFWSARADFEQAAGDQQ